MSTDKLIAMQENLGMGHKGKIILVTQKCLDNNTKAIADDILNAEWADFIVRAANSHAALVKSLKNMVWVHDNLCKTIDEVTARYHGTPIPRAIEFVADAKAALKLAEKE